MKWLKLFKKYRTEEEKIAKICHEYGIKNWSINKDGLVDVAGYVDLSNKRLTKLPLKFGMVSGSFLCQFNDITTLEGAPESVFGNFNCCNNKLTTLEGAPYSVDGSFYCYNNELTTLKGAPESVGSHFYCNNNKLTTLEGAPQVGNKKECLDNGVGGNFNCRYNNLTTLEGAPESVNGDFWCNDNELTTLEGAPESVSGNFNCSENKLTTLEGAPQAVGGIFFCNNNELTTLKFAPYSVDDYFWCDRNPLHPLIQRNIQSINHILAYQEIYHIYNSDGSINEKQFYLMMFSSYLKKSESQKKINDIIDIFNDIDRLTKSYKGNLSKKEILDVLLKSLISYDRKDKPKIISKLAETNPKNFERLKQIMNEIGEDTFKADLNKDMGDLGF